MCYKGPRVTALSAAELQGKEYSGKPENIGQRGRVSDGNASAISLHYGSLMAGCRGFAVTRIPEILSWREAAEAVSKRQCHLPTYRELLKLILDTGEEPNQESLMHALNLPPACVIWTGDRDT